MNSQSTWRLEFLPNQISVSTCIHVCIVHKSESHHYVTPVHENHTIIVHPTTKGRVCIDVVANVLQMYIGGKSII